LARSLAPGTHMLQRKDGQIYVLLDDASRRWREDLETSTSKPFSRGVYSHGEQRAKVLCRYLLVQANVSMCPSRREVQLRGRRRTHRLLFTLGMYEAFKRHCDRFASIPSCPWQQCFSVLLRADVLLRRISKRTMLATYKDKPQAKL